MTNSINDLGFRECVEILNSVKPDLDKLNGVIQSDQIPDGPVR